MSPVDALQDTLERTAIREVQSRYFAGLDRRDYGMVLSCFAPDASATYGGHAVGPGADEIVEWLRGLERIKRSMHFMLNHTADINGDTAKSETYATSHLVLNKDGKEVLRSRGLRYLDTWARLNGEWVISERTHVIDWERVDPVTVPTPARRTMDR